MYRFEDRIVARSTHDEYGWVREPTTVEVRLRTFRVLRVTPKGRWIDVGCGNGYERFVKNDTHRKYACPTIEEARESFLARKQRQCSILATQLERAQRAIAVALGKKEVVFLDESES